MTVSLSLTVIFAVWAGWLLFRRYLPLSYSLPLLLAGLFLGSTELGAVLGETAAAVIRGAIDGISQLIG